MSKLEEDFKLQEETLLKRHADINKMLKENSFMRGELDAI